MKKALIKITTEDILERLLLLCLMGFFFKIKPETSNFLNFIVRNILVCLFCWFPVFIFHKQQYLC